MVLSAFKGRIILYFSILLHFIAQWVLKVMLQVDKNTHAINSKINEENRTGKHKWKPAKCNRVQVKTAKQIPSGIRK
jgi:hypothetical protein